jgi:hypothetical protein
MTKQLRQPKLKGRQPRQGFQLFKASSRKRESDTTRAVDPTQARRPCAEPEFGNYISKGWQSQKKVQPAAATEGRPGRRRTLGARRQKTPAADETADFFWESPLFAGRQAADEADSTPRRPFLGRLKMIDLKKILVMAKIVKL